MGNDASRSRRPQRRERVIPLDDWDFSGISGKEMAPCVLYEYARERARESGEWRDVVQKIEELERLPEGHPKRQEILALHMRGLEIFGGITRIPDEFDVLAASFPETPWLSLDGSRRNEMCKCFRRLPKLSKREIAVETLVITLERELAEIFPVPPEDFPSWVSLDKQRNAPELLGNGSSKSQQEQPKAVPSKGRSRSGESALHCVEVRLPREIAPPVHHREHGFIAVDWDYPDSDLLKAFDQWISDHRKGRKPKHSLQGKEKHKHLLKCLGVKRLFDAGYTTERAQEYTQEHVRKPKDESKKRPIFEDPSAWYDARNREVPIHLHRLFDPPFSWSRFTRQLKA